MLKSVSSVSTCESHWSGAARLPLLRVRIGLQATSDVDLTKLKPGAEAVGRSRVSEVSADAMNQVSFRVRMRTSNADRLRATCRG